MTQKALFPPVKEALSLYEGNVMHARLDKVAHRFNYNVFSILIDLDRLEEAEKKSALFSINHFNIVSFYEKDHGRCDGTSLSQWARALLKEAGLQEEITNLYLSCYPRLLGFVFNPISVYFAYGEKNEIVGLIYEVRNTFGGKHSYVAKLEDGQLTQAGIRQERNKIFYVSPFIAPDARYFFRIVPPADTLKIRIFETLNKKPKLSATYKAVKKKITTTHLIKVLLRIPFMTLKVIIAIHYEALKLWWKGAPYFKKGKQTHSYSLKDTHKKP